MEYKLIRSNRKTLSLEITENCEILVRAPKNLSKRYIENFVFQKSDWINEKLDIVSQRNNRKQYSEEDILKLKQKAKEVLPKKVKYWSEITGFIPTGLKVTSAKKRFGSCSAGNSLCFSLYLFDYPNEAIDYVVVHELCHIKEHNHSAKFWNLVKTFLPDYKEREKLLK